MELRNRPRWRFTAILLACLILSLICVLYPIYVIRPFRAQGARELAVALAVLRFRPLLTMLSALLAIRAAIGYWRVQDSNLAAGPVNGGRGAWCVFSRRSRA